MLLPSRSEPYQGQRYDKVALPQGGIVLGKISISDIFHFPSLEVYRIPLTFDSSGIAVSSRRVSTLVGGTVAFYPDFLKVSVSSSKDFIVR